MCRPKGVYNMIDNDHNHYAVYGGVNVLKSTDDGVVDAPLRIVKTMKITDALPSNIAKGITRAVGVGMTYDGNIAIAAPGIITLLDRDLTMKGYIVFPGEQVDNGIAIDEAGIYVVSSKNIVFMEDMLMVRRFVACSVMLLLDGDRPGDQTP